jgi:hypothetical protein
VREHRPGDSFTLYKHKVMHITENTKPRINLAEYRFLERSVEDTAIGCKREAIQGIVSYAKLALGICLKDEAAAYIYHLETKQAPQLRLA